MNQIETALRVARAHIQSKQSVSAAAALAEIDRALQMIGGDTRECLLAIYGRPWLPLDRYAEDLLGLTYKTCLNRISAGTMPLPVARIAGRWCITIDALAALVDTQSEHARSEFLARQRNRAAA